MNAGMIDMVLGMLGVKAEDKARVTDFVLKLPALADEARTKINEIGATFGRVETKVDAANSKLDVLIHGPGQSQTEAAAAAVLIGGPQHGDGSGGIIGGSSPLRGDAE